MLVSLEGAAECPCRVLPDAYGSVRFQGCLLVPLVRCYLTDADEADIGESADSAWRVAWCQA